MIRKKGSRGITQQDRVFVDLQRTQAQVLAPTLDNS